MFSVIRQSCSRRLSVMASGQQAVEITEIPVERLVAKSVAEIYPLDSVFSGPRQTEITVPAVKADIGL